MMMMMSEEDYDDNLSKKEVDYDSFFTFYVFSLYCQSSLW